jgi:hypothetical protein
MALGMMTHGTQEIGDGLATGRHDGPKPQHEDPVIRWVEKAG